ncbi:aminotransferase class IV [Methylocystis sp. JAN1]|uniref:aminotransferase class IV n=1 Tax=Methylocystis sp. JAN1 TaxID=3397211 RepID=UPI003FA2C111
MSDQSPLPDGSEDFGLIETLLWTREGGYALLPEHLARLAASSAALGFRHDEEKVKSALQSAVPALADDASPSPRLRGEGRGEGQSALTPPASHPDPAERLRVRLVLSRDGAVEVTKTPVGPVPPETVWRVTLAARRFDSSNPLLRHKTTRRALYEEELARAVQRSGADEVLFLNERGELCESARCNLFVPAEGGLLTPPLSCGLLAGTLRAALLRQGCAEERVLGFADLPRDFYLGNSVRGLIRSTLID